MEMWTGGASPVGAVPAELPTRKGLIGVSLLIVG